MARLYQTPPKAELRADLPIRDGTVEPYRFLTIMRLDVPDLLPGDVVQVMAQFEATNPYDQQVMLSHMLTRGEPGEPHGAGWTVIPPARRAGENITPEMHHAHRTLVGAFEVEQAGPDTIRLVAWAAMRGANKDMVLVIEKGQGGISAIVHRADC